MKILDQEISCFRNYFVTTDPRPVNLLTWLKSDKYRGIVEAIRRETDPAKAASLKAGLPAITPSGLFNARNDSALVSHSGLICIDIDGKDNPHIANFNSLKWELSKLANVAYAGLSVSCKGFFLLIPIAYPSDHRAHFYALQNDFLRYGIRIDKACKDLSRLRGASWDPEPYFNFQATPYQKRQQKEAHVAARKAPAETGTTAPGISPWQDFNQKIDAVDLLVSHGWVIVGEDPAKVYLLRPGSSTAPYSGNYHKAKRVFVCHSSSTPFEPEKGYAAAAVYAILEHAGDFSKAARALRLMGYGG